MMNAKNKLRNTLISKLDSLSTEKLTEIENLLCKIEKEAHHKESTIKLAGSWKDMDSLFFNEMTEKLHEIRASDRQNSFM
jgi:hypothetical protein